MGRPYALSVDEDGVGVGAAGVVRGRRAIAARRATERCAILVGA
jgi:hypothetical protein